MNEISSTFESLSNEILSNIFQYFNTPDLFHSFYNLNTSLNQFIQSLPHLHLTLSNDKDFPNLYLFSFYLHSLLTLGEAEIDLHQFPHLRHLILHSPSPKLLKQLEITPFPYLEYLSIPDILFGMSPIFQKIFSNRFPHLNSCHLFGYETIETIRKWTHTTSLRILKIGFIDFHVYKIILFSCPNLFHLKLQLFQSYLKLSDIQQHSNLKKLEIQSEITDWRYNDQLIDIFLACVSNIEQLCISQSISLSKVVELIPDYDWFASVIALRLPDLKHFIFSLHLDYHSEFVEFLGTETRRELRRYFFNAHSNRYQSRLIIN